MISGETRGGLQGPRLLFANGAEVDLVAEGAAGTVLEGSPDDAAKTRRLSTRCEAQPMSVWRSPFIVAKMNVVMLSQMTTYPRWLKMT